MSEQCGTNTTTGNPCKRNRLPGFSACFSHLPEDEIQAAEDKFGRIRCGKRIQNDQSTRFGEICAHEALQGSNPPRCEDHLLKMPPNRRAIAERQVETAAREQLGDLIEREGVVVETPRLEDIANPFLMLMEQAQRVMDFQAETKRNLDKLQADEWRYSGDRIGEQIRGEVVLYERQLKAATDMLAKIAKLNIEERLARINERQAAIIEMAIVRTLAELDLPLELQAQARTRIVNHMKTA
jgi:hypothetical protein